jgi:hypothetical protein
LGDQGLTLAKDGHFVAAGSEAHTQGGGLVAVGAGVSFGDPIGLEERESGRGRWV